MIFQEIPVAPSMFWRPFDIKGENDRQGLLSSTPPLFGRRTVVPVERRKMFPMEYGMKLEAPPNPFPAVPMPAVDPVIQIFCGTLSARLHLEYFQCPGIHQPCIEYDGALISPKEFCYRANKDKQKDWKGSIRAGKRSLRYMMEIKAIDFFNHAQVCSGKCLSRNQSGDRQLDAKKKAAIPVPTYSMRSMFDPSAFASFGMPPQLPPIFATHQNSVGMPMMVHDPSQELLKETKPSPTMLLASRVGKARQFEAPQQNGVMSAKRLLNAIDTDPLMFWNEVRRLQLMPEFLDLATTHVSNICVTAGDDTANLGDVAPSLSRLTHALKLQKFIISRIQAQQSNHFAGFIPVDPIIENKAPVGIGHPAEGMEAPQQPIGATSDPEIFCDLSKPQQQPNDSTVSSQQPQAPSRLLKRRQSVDNNEVAYKKTIIELE